LWQDFSLQNLKVTQSISSIVHLSDEQADGTLFLNFSAKVQISFELAEGELSQ
jgi:hypothetical protein